ncbi:MAG: AraC family transcriptional regulator [Spirochaetota bacterium]
MMRLLFPRFESTAAMLDLSILKCGFSVSPGWHYPDTNVPFNRLYINTGGDAFVSVSGRVTRFRKHWAYVLPLNRTISLSCKKGISIFYVHFTLPMGVFDIFEGDVVRGHPIDVDIQRLIAQARSANIGDHLSLRSELGSIIGPFIHTTGGSIRKRMIIAERYAGIVEYVRTNTSAKLGIGTLADIAGTTREALMKRFKRDTGITLKHYIVTALIEAAKKRVLLGTGAIRVIADELGFSDEHYFSRFFKKHTGSSPRDYRRVNAG